MKETYKCCFGCERRTVGCHSHCKEYQKLKNYFDEEKKKIKEDLKCSDFVAIYQEHVDKKLKKRKWGKKI